MSMNPSRTFASAVVAGDFTAFWVYLTAPVIGMLLAARLHALPHRRREVGTRCAKLVHDARVPCVFCEDRGGSGAADG
jgi:aquaporin Z